MASEISMLIHRGVRLAQYTYSMKNQNITPEALIPSANPVKDGMMDIVVDNLPVGCIFEPVQNRMI